MDFLAANQALAAVQVRALYLETALRGASGGERAIIEQAIYDNARAEAWLKARMGLEPESDVTIVISIPDDEWAGDHHVYPAGVAR